VGTNSNVSHMSEQSDEQTILTVACVGTNSNASHMSEQSDKQTMNSDTSPSSNFRVVQTEGANPSLSQSYNSCRHTECSDNKCSKSVGKATARVEGPPRTPNCFFNVVPCVSQAPSDWPTVCTQVLTSQVGDTYPKEIVQIYQAVRKTGLPNFLKAKIPLPHGLNMQAWKEAFDCSNYRDTSLLDFLEFGFPVSFDRQFRLQCERQNHQSANVNPSQVDKYLTTETTFGAMLGPLPTPLFEPWTQINPLMARPKKDTEDMRIIVDLSWPEGGSVNDGIDSDEYLGTRYKLAMPSVDQAVDRLRQLGKGAFLHKRDLSRAYRQLRIDPLDWPLLGLEWKGGFYQDISVPFGLRVGAMMCQRTTDAVTHVMHHQGHFMLNYIDDILGIDSTLEGATNSFEALGEQLAKLGLQEAVGKAEPPNTCLTWLGIELDSEAMEMRIPTSKLMEIKVELEAWRGATHATRKQIQSLLGKLIHISRCVEHARLYLNRIIASLTGETQRVITLAEDFKLDVCWFDAFMSRFNGVSLIERRPLAAYESVEVDSCLTGCGAIFGDSYYMEQFPPDMLALQLPIHCLEIFNIVVAMRMWAHQWSGRLINIWCDNAASVLVLQSGKGRDERMLKCAREIWAWAALYSVSLVVHHRPGNEMTIADALSRSHLDPKFLRVVGSLSGQRCRVPSEMFTWPRYDMGHFVAISAMIWATL